MTKTTCFDVFEGCVNAMQAGDLITSESEKDKEFHFQNWFRSRLKRLGLNFDAPGRNMYPDFRLVKFTERYEVKGLKWPGRDSTYDSNSQVPTGHHNGRQIFYVFGRYPADVTPYPKQRTGRRQYPVVDLVICHGDFLNADHNYVHKNKSVKGPTPIPLAHSSYGRRSRGCQKLGLEALSRVWKERLPLRSGVTIRPRIHALVR